MITAKINDTEVIKVKIFSVTSFDVIFHRYSFVGDGSTTVFTLPNNETFRENSALVFLNGILLQRGIDYTESSDRKSIIFTTAPRGSSGNREADKGEVIYVVD